MNFKIHKILTPIDFSETSMLALDHAVFMAKLYNAQLNFVHIIEQMNYADEFGNIMLIDEKLNTIVQDKLDTLAKSIHIDHGIAVPETMVLTGSIAESIVGAAENAQADIIVMGTHGVSGWTEFFMGSNAYKVVTRSACPVLTIQQHAKANGFRNIVLPIDSSHPSRQKVAHAVEFAQHYGSIIHVVGLITEDEPEVHHKFDVMIKQVNDYLQKHGVAFENKKLVGSNLAKMTMKYAEEINADLIMIMTEQEENLTGLIVGPQAQQVVNHSRIPVLSITPQEIYHAEMVHPY